MSSVGARGRPQHIQPFWAPIALPWGPSAAPPAGGPAGLSAEHLNLCKPVWRSRRNMSILFSTALQTIFAYHITTRSIILRVVQRITTINVVVGEQKVCGRAEGPTRAQTSTRYGMYKKLLK